MVGACGRCNPQTATLGEWRKPRRNEDLDRLIEEFDKAARASRERPRGLPVDVAMASRRMLPPPPKAPSPKPAWPAVMRAFR